MAETRARDTADINATVALKADLASPTFTGTPAGPTAASGTNTTQIATTAFVLANAGGLNLIHTETFSAVSTATASAKLSNTFTFYVIGIDVVASGSVNINLRWRENSGSDITTTYAGSGFFSGTGGTSGVFGEGTTNTGIFFSGTGQGRGRFFVTRPSGTEIYSTYSGIDGAASNVTRADRRTGATNITGLTVFPASGTISGSFSIYGFKE